MLNLPKLEDSDAEGVYLVIKTYEKTPPFKNIANTVFIPEYFEISAVTRNHHPHLGLAGSKYKTAIVFTTDDEKRSAVFELDTIVIPLPSDTEIVSITLSERADAPPDESAESNELYGLWLDIEFQLSHNGKEYSYPILLQEYMPYEIPARSIRLH